MSLVLANGVVVGAVNHDVIIGGIILTGIRKVSFNVKQKKENIVAFQKEPVGRGRGNKEYSDLQMEILLEEYKAIIGAAPGRDPLRVPMFSIPIAYNDSTVEPEVFENVEFTGAGRNISAGDTATWITVDLIFAGLRQ